MLAFDNEDGTWDVMLDSGANLDPEAGMDEEEVTVPVARLDVLTEEEEQQAAARDEEANTLGSFPQLLGDWPKPGVLRCVCISDTHGLHREIKLPMPEGDVLIHAGDLTNTGEMDQIEDFAEWIRGLPYKHKIVIAGTTTSRLSRSTTQDVMCLSGFMQGDSRRRLTVRKQGRSWLAAVPT